MGAPVDSPAAQVRPLQCPLHGTAASPAAGQTKASPSEGPILRLERSELAKRGAFSLPRSRQSPTNGFRSLRPQSPATGIARVFGLLLTFTRHPTARLF